MSTNLPGAPEIVSVTPGDGFAIITWTVPPSDAESTLKSGGDAVTRYVVTGFPDGSRSLEGDVLGVRMGGLSNGQEYTFTDSALFSGCLRYSGSTDSCGGSGCRSASLPSSSPQYSCTHLMPRQSRLTRRKSSQDVAA